MNENIELPEEKEPLLIGKDTNGKIVIQKGKQKFVLLMSPDCSCLGNKTFKEDSFLHN